ncbi:cas scaffolding protein family member 4 isoform X2 [Tupaia chinensis]|uniref:cas scaffolding protein family member 4 isoform X2 n=1 Tax=Tupaia chinensis TaxID=246437 RepID=UPI0003C91C35|nr:cas scaffolding protein family member 4 isoform X2 [Tupaia chinensis]
MKGTSLLDGVPKTLLARALYDNHPDCFDELAFCRGDILTILEKNVPESEGWWKCLLHGRQGLAPANRLQVLSEAPTDNPCLPFLRGPGALASTEETYQVPAPLHSPPSGPVYEQMKSWVEGPPPPVAQVYEFPDLPMPARIVCEKTLTIPRQALVTLSRPARTSLPTLPSQVYDMPAQSRVPAALQEPEKQQLYDVPASSQKAGLHPAASQASGQNLPPAPTFALRKGNCNTLPNPQKSEWIYDTPVSLRKAHVGNPSPSDSAEGSGPHAVPSPVSTFHSPPKSRAGSLTPQLYHSVPMKKKFSLPEIPSGDCPAPRDTFPLAQGVSYKVPSSFLIPRVEQQNTTPNIYDIPKARMSIPQAEKELEKVSVAAENCKGPNPSWFSRRMTPLSPEPDRLSVSSSDSRASVLSSCSSTSTDSSSSSSPEESAREFSVDLDVDLAKETVMALQDEVASATASLMLFVSRKWRFRDYLEANIDSIHRAANQLEDSLRKFLDFARGVCESACHLTNSNLQARIRDQLQTIANSYQILLETKASLDGCNWSLEVLVTDKVQNNLDDLERFVMVARMVPEDIKRFASMVIANGRLLFKQNCEKQETTHFIPKAELKCEKYIQLPRRETELHQRSGPFNRPGENGHSPELSKKHRTSVCGQLPNLKGKEKPNLEQRLEENKDLDVTNALSLKAQPRSPQNPEKKTHLSEHCRLYFGALFKALGVFNSSLSNSQPPETFITQSKLVITVGQKLVDALCKETQERDVRNEILRSSSGLCGLLKALALATKDAVLQYPSPAALGRLQAQAGKLEQHARQFRAMLE